MKHLLTIFFILLLTTFSTKADKPIDTNPVCLGIILIDEPTQEGMADICRSYNLETAPEEDGFQVFKTAIDDKILFRKPDNQTPTIQITTSNKLSKTEDTLIKAGYHKTKSADGKLIYIHGSQAANKYTVCTVLNSRALLFTKIIRQ